MKIVTVYVHPPIPIRRFDWVAHYDDPEGPSAGGETEILAIQNLLDDHPPSGKDILALISVLERCRTVLGNMAKENEGAIFWRWIVAHEPLRADAKALLPEIDEVLK